jgi:transposase
VAVGIETERGLLLRGLLAAGYALYAVNPLAVSRYRERHQSSGAKSDAADAKLLADLVRTDRHNHRPLAPDSELAEALRVLARAHKSLIWSRTRQQNALRSALREYFPAALAAFGSDLGAPEAVAVLLLAPTPARARALSRSRIASALGRAGRGAPDRGAGGRAPGRPAPAARRGAGGEGIGGAGPALGKRWHSWR